MAQIKFSGVYNFCALTTLAGTLISGNSAAAGAELYDGSGGVTANNYNLFGHSGLTNAQAFSNFTPGASDIAATSDGAIPTALNDILNPTLGANNGPTLTHDLASGSPAFDALPTNGAGTACITTDADGNPLTEDQRGFQRPAGAACDIGALELGMGGPGGPNLGANSEVRRGAVFGVNFSLGENSVLEDHARVGDNVSIGNDSRIKRSAALGDNVTVGDNTLIKNHARIGDNVQIGDFTTIGRSAAIGDNATIGSNVLVASHVTIGAGTTVGDGTTIADTGAGIGENVIIGANVTIKSGVRIGDGATVAAGSVVPRDTVIPDGASFP